MAESDNLPVPVNGPSGNGVPSWWTDKYGPVPCLTSIPQDGGAEARAMLFSHLQGESEDAEGLVNSEFTIQHRTFTPGRKVNEDGEVSEFIRTIITTADNRQIAFGSQGVVKSLHLIQQLLMGGTWKPGLRVRLISRKLKSGHRWFELEPLDLAKPPTVKRK